MMGSGRMNTTAEQWAELKALRGRKATINHPGTWVHGREIRIEEVFPSPPYDFIIKAFYTATGNMCYIHSLEHIIFDDGTEETIVNSDEYEGEW